MLTLVQQSYIIQSDQNHKVKGIEVLLGHSERDPEKYCSDGDSLYITGYFQNELVRLLGIDALEIRGLNLYYLKKSGFLDTLDGQLQKYLQPKLTKESIKTHKNLGFETKEYLESILEEDLVVSFDKEVFDRYDRFLVYLSAAKGKSYNLLLVQTGYALPYLIYPNTISLTEDEKWNYDKIEEIQKITIRAKKQNPGIWAHIDHILLPMELRFLTRRELPQKYCADLQDHLLYPPEHYFKIPIENRLFFYPKDVILAIQHGFNPVPHCAKWLHEVWKALQKDSQKEEHTERNREIP
jgi:endonuclease YncB( thermonuclease family)